MVELDLDDREQMDFERGINGYGAVLAGGTAEERIEALQNALDTPQLRIDCRNISSKDEFVEQFLRETTSMSDERINKIASPGPVDMKRGLAGTGKNILILEFDSMSDDTQKGVAQLMKGLIETVNEWDEQIGYTAVDGDAVITAESNLIGRVHSVEL